MSSQHVNLEILFGSGSQSMALRPAATAPPGTLLEMHILRPTQPGFLGPNSLRLNGPVEDSDAGYNLRTTVWVFSF